MKQTTKQIIGNNKWILCKGMNDGPVSFFPRLRDAEIYGSCAVIRRRRIPHGYEEVSDDGRTDYYLRVESLNDKALDEYVRASIQYQLDDIMETINARIYIADAEGTLEEVKTK